MKRKKIIIGLILLNLLFPLISSSVSAQDEPEIIPVYPKPEETIGETLPTIKVEFDSNRIIDEFSVEFLLDGLDFTFDEETTITPTQLTYEVPEIFELSEGNHTITVKIADINGNKNESTWMFFVDKSVLAEETVSVKMSDVIFWVILGTIIFFIALAVYILYLKQTRNFTWRKYFVQHPKAKEYMILYIPVVISFLFVVLGFTYVSNTEEEITPYALEYILVIGFLIGILPYAIHSIIDKRTLDRYERAFSQFLFEMADAMRGGLDPAKAIIEIASTDTGILKNSLRRAADAVRLGRPFDEIMTAMVRHFKSDLIKRYASLIGEASKVGGETSQVVHRAAKDMDDFIKVSNERRRQLSAQASIIYIAFAVLLIILYILLEFFPSFEGLNLSLLGNPNPEALADADAAGSKVSEGLLKRRFFHVLLVNSVCTGVIIGMFVDGKAKNGLLHSIALVLVTVLFFSILIL